MNKLIIAIAAFATAMVVNAATVNWQATNIYQPGTTVKAAGYIGYFFQDTGFDKTEIAKSIIDKSFDTKYASSALASSSSNNGVIAKTGIGNYDAGTYNFFTVLFDASTSGNAKNYIITDNVAVSYSSATGGKSAAFAYITGSAGQNWTAVPEPTSAMLLLLGVAGLALKRKQK